MREIYRIALKNFLRFEFLNARIQLQLTQEEMAEKLNISTVAYNEIENGVYLCSTTTLALFIANCCPNPEAFVQELQSIIEKIAYGEIHDTSHDTPKKRIK